MGSEDVRESWLDLPDTRPLAARESTGAFWYQEARIFGGIDLMGGSSGGGGRRGRSGGGGGGSITGITAGMTEDQILERSNTYVEKLNTGRDMRTYNTDKD